MTTAGGAPILVHSEIRRPWILIPILVLMLSVCGGAAAQTLYKYRGENGEWIYTDRPPVEGQKTERRKLQLSFVPPEFLVTHEASGTIIEFVARNEFHAPVEVEINFVEITGVEYPHPDDPLRWVVAARSDLLLLTLEVLQEVARPFVDYKYQYAPGDPSAAHRAGDGYRAPFSVGSVFPVVQAYPDSATHRAYDTMYAVDFGMPVGTDIVAARSGVVFDVVTGNYTGGLDSQGSGKESNIVRILHDDGTFAMYANLNWNTVRVRPGDRVHEGQYIADSGDMDVSSSPHLHFAVQKNTGLKTESMPVTFKIRNSGSVIPSSGSTVTAYAN